jgi:hypothetical protein
MTESDFMCERPDAMTPERLAEIEEGASTSWDGAEAFFWELVEEIKLLWEDKLSMVPMEQA